MLDLWLMIFIRFLDSNKGSKESDDEEVVATVGEAAPICCLLLPVLLSGFHFFCGFCRAEVDCAIGGNRVWRSCSWLKCRGEGCVAQRRKYNGVGFSRQGVLRGEGRTVGDEDSAERL